MYKFGVIIVLLFLGIGALASFISPFDFDQVRDSAGDFGILAEPNSRNLLGTTSLGMDVLSRLLLGTQTALLVIVISVIASFAWGLMLSILSSSLPSQFEKFFMFITDVFISIPSLLIGIVFSLGISSGKSSYFVAIIATVVSEVLLFGSKYFRVLRISLNEVSKARFVEAGRVLGLSKSRLFWLHEIPNSLSAVPVMMAQNAANAVFTLAGLGFLGVGIQANSGAEWGYDINKGLSDLQLGYWWTTTFSSAALALLIVGFGLVAEGVSEDKHE